MDLLGTIKCAIEKYEPVVVVAVVVILLAVVGLVALGTLAGAGRDGNKKPCWLL